MEDQITAYFEERIAACRTAATALNTDGRADEGVFEKIRMNVFDIFRQVYSASGRSCGSNEQKRLEFLRKQLDAIPSTWQTSLEAARNHGDIKKAHIEQIKLAAAAEIQQKATEWSGSK